MYSSDFQESLLAAMLYHLHIHCSLTYHQPDSFEKLWLGNSFVFQLTGNFGFCPAGGSGIHTHILLLITVHTNEATLDKVSILIHGIQYCLL